VGTPWHLLSSHGGCGILCLLQLNAPMGRTSRVQPHQGYLAGAVLSHYRAIPSNHRSRSWHKLSSCGGILHLALYHRRQIGRVSRLTIHSSRRCFATRLNSSVRPHRKFTGIGMKNSITLALLLACSTSSAQEIDQLSPIEHETRMYYRCAIKAASEYLVGTSTASEVTDAALSACDRYYLSLLDAQKLDLKQRAGASIESQQRAEQWAQGGTDVRKKVIREKVLQFVVSERAKAH